ncbi:hypothetical protein HDU90_005386 [Geranomyces variabilis]|nr:hypothetical protein HDU90_005386 [Geranomyces variabilis]
MLRHLTVAGLLGGELGTVVANVLRRCYDIHLCPYQDNADSIRVDVGQDNIAACFYDNYDCTGLAKCFTPGTQISNLPGDGLKDKISAFAFNDPDPQFTALHNGGGFGDHFQIQC